MENYKYDKLDFSKVLIKRYKEFTPVINEYFSRLKVDLNFSDEEIKSKVKLLLDNVNEIKFESIREKYKGAFIPKEHKILFNLELLKFKQDYEELFHILTHELDHATNYNKKDKKFGMYRYDKRPLHGFNPNDLLLDEIRTDIGASRRVYNDKYTDDTKMIRKTKGYKNFTVFSTMLQNCLGITEKEFIQSSKNGRDTFDKEMKTKFLDENDYTKFMEIFTTNTSIIYNDRNKETNLILENRNIYKDSFDNLKKLSYIGLNLKMEKDISDNIDINLSEYLKNIRYSIEENNKNFNFASHEFAATDRLNNIIEKSDIIQFDDILKYVNSVKKEPKSKVQNVVESKIMYLEMLSENKSILGEKYKTAVESVISLKSIFNLKSYAKNNLKLDFQNNKEAQFEKELDPDIVAKRKNEKENIYYWDNSSVIEDMKVAFYVNEKKHCAVPNKIEVKTDNKDFKENELKSSLLSSTRSINEIFNIDKEKIYNNINLSNGTHKSNSIDL